MKDSGEVIFLKKKGFSIVEVVVIVAIIFLLGSFGTMKIKGRSEKNAMIKVKSTITEFIRVSAHKAFEKGEEYRIVINILDKAVRRKDSDGSIEEEIVLPDVLSYKLGSGTDTEYEIKIDDTGHGTLVGFGGLNRNLFVFSSSGEALYKINMRDNTALGYIIINSYVPKTEMDESNYTTGTWVKE
jgi:type II secretory pathway pseudopilin PulG